MNNSPVIGHIGIIVSLIYEKGRWHKFAIKQASNLPVSFFTCEAAITESCFLLHQIPDGEQKVLQMTERGILEINFLSAEEAGNMKTPMKKYANVPMSLTGFRLQAW